MFSISTTVSIGETKIGKARYLSKGLISDLLLISDKISGSIKISLKSNFSIIDNYIFFFFLNKLNLFHFYKLLSQKLY